MYRNFSLTEKEKKDILEQHGRYGYKKPLNEQPFNSGGEPMMTQRQYNDYSEPSEPDYNDNDYYGDDDQKIVQDELKRKLEKNDILLETFDGEEFFIRCRGDNDFMIYFEGEKVKIYENGREGEKENTFNLMDAFNYIMDNRNKFHNYQESAKSRNDDFENDRRYRDHSRGEQMSENQFNEEEFSDGGKFRISHAGVTVNKIIVNVELTEDYENDSVNFTLKSDRDGNLTIVDFDNPSYGEIDDEEVREYMESMISSGKINVPDFISFDPETGKVDRYN